MNAEATHGRHLGAGNLALPSLIDCDKEQAIDARLANFKPRPRRTLLDAIREAVGA